MSRGRCAVQCSAVLYTLYCLYCTVLDSTVQYSSCAVLQAINLSASFGLGLYASPYLVSLLNEAEEDNDDLLYGSISHFEEAFLPSFTTTQEKKTKQKENKNKWACWLAGDGVLMSWDGFCLLFLFFLLLLFYIIFFVAVNLACAIFIYR